MLGTYLGAHLSRFISGPVQLVFFGVIMLLAAWMMFRKASQRESAKAEEKEGEEDPSEKRPVVAIIALEGVVVGIITGLVGVGGGFLIVPALVILGRLPMRLAIGTSLAIIALNSLIGFGKYLNVLETLQLEVDWATIALFVALGSIGSLTGKMIGTKLNQHVLRRAFAIFLVIMGLFVLSREIPHLMSTGPAVAASHGARTVENVSSQVAAN
jgi:uncharacterized membrane protein YfcA